MQRGLSPSVAWIATPRNAVAFLAVILAALAAGLRPDAFFAGDPGIKLIAARTALEHPAHPLDLPLPTIAGAAAPHVEPFFSVHGSHAHAVTSPIFPLVSAPVLGLLGLRGLYVLPALGFIVAVVGIARLANLLDPRRSALTAGIVAAVATPFAFYGLEFWEHMPAVACGAVGLTLWLRGRGLGAGVLLGGAVLLRPEAAWFTAAIAAASPWLPYRPTWRPAGRAVAGLALVLAPYAIYVIGHFGTLIPPHLAANSGAATGAWLGTRQHLAAMWLGLGSSSVWTVAPCVIGALASVALPSARQGRRALWVVAAVTFTLTFLTAPNDGGSQWGPRYLLFVYVPLSILAADLVDQLPSTRVGVTVLVVMLVGCVWIDRRGYRELKSAKASYGRLVDFIAEKTVESNTIVTDVWWLDQVATAALDRHQVLFTPDAATAASVVARLSDATVPVVHVIRSLEESSDSTSWSAGTCYFEERRDTTSVRRLVSIQLRHRCGFATAR